MESAELLELAEHQPHDVLHLLVWVEGHLPRGAPDVADRQWLGQLAATRLAEPALVHPLLEDVQLRLAHRALEPEQQAVVVLRRVVDAVEVRNERPAQRADLQELMPILARAGQARHLHAEHEPDMVQADLRDEALKAQPPLDTGARLAQIVVDHQDPVRGPAQRLGARDETILQPGRLLMIEHLLHGGLADVDDGQPIPMQGAYFPGRPVGGHARRQ
jgi:hypothetical protein